MARDFQVIATHQLQFESPRELAEILSKIFDVNVFIIFQSYIDLKPIDASIQTITECGLSPESEGTFYLFDKVVGSPFRSSMRLEIEDYMYTWFHLKLGNEAGSNESFMSYWSKNPTENNEIIQSFMIDSTTYRAQFDDGVYEDVYLNIYRGSLSVFNDKYPFYGWWGLYRIFLDWDERETKEEIQNHMLYFLNFRNRNMEILKLVGCTEAYYIKEGSVHTKGIGQGNEYDDTRDEIEAILKSPESITHQVDLQRSFMDLAYMRKMHSLAAKTDQEYYSLFHDNFGRVDRWTALANFELLDSSEEA